MLTILFENADLLAIAKPSGLLSIPDGFNPDLPNARDILAQDFGKLWTVHRLDKDTSGILLFAKNAEAHRELNEQFTHHSIKKEYRAIVLGSFPETLSIEKPLRINVGSHHRTIIDEVNGKAARTDFECQEVFHENYSLISVFPCTGYTHQIRTHLYSAGYPILFDPLYFTELSTHLSLEVNCRRLMLHAFSIQFVSPQSSQPITLTCPLPKDFTDCMHLL
jgi:RluA family pseudouridine synthase